MINEKGGIDNRKISFLTLDDAYSPAKTVEQTRRLVESNRGASADVWRIRHRQLYRPCKSILPIRRYRSCSLVTGASKWEALRNFPGMIGWQPTYRAEAIVYAGYLLRTKPDAND